jgi:hypothetical protein
MTNLHLVALTAEQCELLVKALGVYNAEFAFTSEVPLIVETAQRLSLHATQG